MDVRLRAERFVGDEIPNPAVGTTRNLAEYSTAHWHGCSPDIRSTIDG
jgi:hypothetical protein